MHCSVELGQLLAVYTTLQQFSYLLQVSPFRFEDLCAAIHEKPDADSAVPNLLSEIHVALLAEILKVSESEFLCGEGV